MDKNIWFDKFNREPTFDDFLDFMQDRAAAYKTSVGQEVLRQKQDRKKAQKSDTEVKKKKKPEKPSRTLATTAAATTSSTPNEKPTSTPSSSTTRSRNDKPQACKYCSKEHSIRECESFKVIDVQKRLDSAKEKNVCLNCLGNGHRVEDCKSRGAVVSVNNVTTLCFMEHKQSSLTTRHLRLLPRLPCVLIKATPLLFRL